MIFNNLKRITSSESYIPQIDGLRFIAIAMVVVFHLSEKMNKTNVDIISRHVYNAVSMGHQGVELFFAISGFVLALPFAKHYFVNGKKVSIKQYFIRRLTRLEPPFLITMFGFFTMYLLTDKTYHLKAEGLNFITAITYTHNFYTNGHLWRMNGVTWSLEIEVQFYIIAPIVFKLFKINNAVLRRALFILIILILSFLNNINLIHFLSLANFFQFFMVGILVADFYIVPTKFDIQKNWVSFLGGFCFFIIIFTRYDSSIFNYFMFLICMFFFFLIVLKNRFWSKVFSKDILAIVGGMCYTIYLLHFPILGAVMKITNKFKLSGYYLPNFLLQCLIIIPIIMLVSIIFFLLIERPCMNKDWPRKLLNYKRKTIQTA